MGGRFGNNATAAVKILVSSFHFISMGSSDSITVVLQLEERRRDGTIRWVRSISLTGSRAEVYRAIDRYKNVIAVTYTGT
jgi:hypothetical protein